MSHRRSWDQKLLLCFSVLGSGSPVYYRDLAIALLGRATPHFRPRRRLARRRRLDRYELAHCPGST
ncbi:MAG: hypothetical protein IT349_11890 [Candidatus Eisenbacteria bacterium]|nr:hypothetical protein [Candidatus Eisenbacteria bacterium]